LQCLSHLLRARKRARIATVIMLIMFITNGTSPISTELIALSERSAIG